MNGAVSGHWVDREAARFRYSQHGTRFRISMSQEKEPARAYCNPLADIYRKADGALAGPFRDAGWGLAWSRNCSLEIRR